MPLEPSLQPAIDHLCNRLAHGQLLLMVGAAPLGDSSDLDIVWHRGHGIQRLDLHVADRRRPTELVEFLAALATSTRR